MKKGIIFALLISVLLSGCSNKKVDELSQKVNTLNDNISSLEAEKKLLEEKVSYYMYTPGEPTTEGTPVTNTADIEEILISMDSKIVGGVSNALGYGNSITFDITTEKGGVYRAFLTMNEEKDDVSSLIIYLNSELCYTWLNSSMFPIGTGEWKLDVLSN